MRWGSPMRWFSLFCPLLFGFLNCQPKILGGKIAVNRRQLKLYRRRLMGNRRRLAGDRQQFLTDRYSVDAQARWGPTGVFLFFVLHKGHP